MFLLCAVKNQLSVGKREPLTSGSVNVYQVKFDFSSDWDGLRRVALFQAGCREKSVNVDESGLCTIPWEVLVEPGWKLMAGVHGFRGNDLVLPTDWASLGPIKDGAVNGAPLFPPTPELWEQALDQKGDRLDYTEQGELGLYAGDRELSAVPVKADHRQMSHRDAAEQHPIESITGLTKELERIPKPVEALTNSELEELLK